MNSYWWGNKCREAKGINWSAWDRLYALKEDDRMGFQNVFAFNLAMLGKQGWRVTIVPNGLSLRVFKAKYFPGGDFMEALLGHNPSFTW